MESPNPDRPRTGRPSKLDPVLIARVIEALSNGCTVKVACQAAGLGCSTFRAWVRRGKFDRPADRDYRAFRAAVQKARAQGEAHALAIIRNAMADHWQAAAWYLERSHPERWGRALNRLELSGPKGEPIPAPPIQIVEIHRVTRDECELPPAGVPACRQLPSEGEPRP